MIDREYARTVAVLMAIRAWNVEQIASAVGVSRQAVYGWLNGKQPQHAERDKLRVLLLEWAEKYAKWFDLEWEVEPTG